MTSHIEKMLKVCLERETLHKRHCLLVGSEPYSSDGTFIIVMTGTAVANQPGPIYFKTLRKCALLGVWCEAIPCQVNFLIHENAQTGKGAKSTISYVHYYFECHGLGETKAQLHADNCGARECKIPQIKTYYHFRFNKECSGTVFCKQYWDSEKRWLIFLKTNNLPIYIH